ncbi:MAG: hypothetical protein ABEJ36_00185 [Candidatus Nanosalina sp.]
MEKTSKRRLGYIFIPVGFLAVARLNQFLIELIFGPNIIVSFSSIFLLSCILPVTFWISGNFNELEEKLDKIQTDAERKALEEIVPFFGSFFIVLIVVKVGALLNVGILFDYKEVKEAMIGLNYGTIIAIIIYTLRSDFKEEKIDKIYSYRKRLEIL